MTKQTIGTVFTLSMCQHVLAGCSFGMLLVVVEFTEVALDTESVTRKVRTWKALLCSCRTPRHILSSKGIMENNL